MQQKTKYTPFLELFGTKFSVPEKHVCKKEQACRTRAEWYGHENIGSRLYALYKCTKHGLFRVRLTKKEHAAE